MTSSWYRRLLVISGVVGSFLLALPAGADDLPAVQQQAGIAYLSGGIGLDESTAISAESRKWPLTLLFAVKGGQKSVYTSDAQVRVLDGRGKVLLQTKADGPYLLLRLAPGAYVVEAALNGKSLQQKMVLKKDVPARVVFVWPAPAGEEVQE